MAKRDNQILGAVVLGLGGLAFLGLGGISHLRNAFADDESGGSGGGSGANQVGSAGGSEGVSSPDPSLGETQKDDNERNAGAANPIIIHDRSVDQNENIRIDSTSQTGSGVRNSGITLRNVPVHSSQGSRNIDITLPDDSTPQVRRRELTTVPDGAAAKSFNKEKFGIDNDLAISAASKPESSRTIEERKQLEAEKARTVFDSRGITNF